MSPRTPLGFGCQPPSQRDAEGYVRWKLMLRSMARRRKSHWARAQDIAAAVPPHTAPRRLAPPNRMGRTTTNCLPTCHVVCSLS